MASCRSPTPEAGAGGRVGQRRGHAGAARFAGLEGAAGLARSPTLAALKLQSAGSSGIHELSDLRIVADDRLIAVSDGGSVFEARLLFDSAARLSGLTNPRVLPLVGEHGEPLAGCDADAEGLAVFPNGDRLVSFERHHRIWLYPADGSARRSDPRARCGVPRQRRHGGPSTLSCSRSGRLSRGERGRIDLALQVVARCRRELISARSLPPATA